MELDGWMEFGGIGETGVWIPLFYWFGIMIFEVDVGAESFD